MERSLPFNFKKLFDILKIEKSNIELIWQTTFIIVPAIILARLNECFADDNWGGIILAGLFAAVGGIVGGLIFQLIGKKSILIKIISLVFLAVLPTLVLIGTTKWVKPYYLTCEICGYKSVNSQKQECEVCGNVTWDIKVRENNSLYSTKQIWLREEQLYWFGLDDSVNFFLPVKEGNFEKDKTWKPLITKEDIASDTL